MGDPRPAPRCKQIDACGWRTTTKAATACSERAPAAARTAGGQLARDECQEPHRRRRRDSTRWRQSANGLLQGGGWSACVHGPSKTSGWPKSRPRNATARPVQFSLTPPIPVWSRARPTTIKGSAPASPALSVPALRITTSSAPRRCPRALATARCCCLRRAFLLRRSTSASRHHRPNRHHSESRPATPAAHTLSCAAVAAAQPTTSSLPLRPDLDGDPRAACSHCPLSWTLDRDWNARRTRLCKPPATYL